MNGRARTNDIRVRRDTVEAVVLARGSAHGCGQLAALLIYFTLRDKWAPSGPVHGTHCLAKPLDV